MSIYKNYLDFCTNQKSQKKFRNLLQTYSSSNFIDFSSNDYLGLSKRTEVTQAANEAARNFGIGSTGSRLLSGNHKIFEELETQIAIDKKTESALIFNSGFQANFSVLSSLLDASVLGKAPLVFFDKLNHSSLYQAVFLSKAELIRYHHNDMQHLSELLEKYKNDDRSKFIVAETVFGMDGDLLAIQEIANLAKQYDAFLYLDEAHATGLYGVNSYGLSTNIRLEGIQHLIMGTFSKAIGCAGSYIACSNIVKDFLINKSPGFIYSTSLPPMLIAAAQQAWKMIPNFNQERQKIFSLAIYLRENLKNLGLNTGNSTSHIIPIIIGKEEETIKAKDQLFKNGIIVSSIRPPTVPPKTSRLRIAINVKHSENDIEKLIQCLKKL